MANPKDFQPVSGMKVRDDGVVVNEANGINEDGSQNSKITGSDIQQPVEIQGHITQSIQTHNAVSIAANGNNTNSTWQDANGFVDLALSVISDSGTAQFAATVLWSHDGTNVHGAEVVISGGAAIWANSRAGQAPIKARYFKVVLLNSDSAVAHTMSAYAYLKA